MHITEQNCLWDYGGQTWTKRPLGRPKHRYIDNVKVDHKKLGLEVVYGINMVQDTDKW